MPSNLFLGIDDVIVFPSSIDTLQFIFCYQYYSIHTLLFYTLILIFCCQYFSIDTF